MSAAGSPAPGESENRKKEVAFRFCQECSNLLYPKEDRATNELLYVCRACHAIQKHDSACTFRKHYAANVQETAGVTTDVSSDPTVGTSLQDSICLCTLCGDEVRCSQCGQSGTEDSELVGLHGCISESDSSFSSYLAPNRPAQNAKSPTPYTSSHSRELPIRG